MCLSIYLKLKKKKYGYVTETTTTCPCPRNNLTFIEKHLHHYHHCHLLLVFSSLTAFNEARDNHMTTRWTARTPCPSRLSASLVDNLRIMIWGDFVKIPFHAQWMEMMKRSGAEAVCDVNVHMFSLVHSGFNVPEQSQISACRTVKTVCVRLYWPAESH